MRPPRPTHARAASLALVLATTACGAYDAAGDGPLGAAGEAILGGTADATDTAIVAIVDTDAKELCTGTLIAQNLVITARHCVAPIENLVNGTVVCGTATFGATHAPLAFMVSAAEVVDQGNVDQYDAKEVLVPAGDAVCGGDVALLVLTKSVPTNVAAPLAPRLAASPAKGEAYAAIGYGTTAEEAQDSGSRRRKDALAVACLGDACQSEIVTASEWVGDTSLCSGDSGGPAVGADGTLIGVGSRSGLGCVTPVYADLSARAQWVVDSAVHAATAGGYEAPAWTKEPIAAPDAGGGGGGTSSGGSAVTHAPAPTNAYGTAPGHGCEVERGASGAGSAALGAWALAVAAAAAGRRRRRAAR